MVTARLNIAMTLPSHAVIKGPWLIAYGLAWQDAVYCKECSTTMTNFKGVQLVYIIKCNIKIYHI